MLKILAPAKIDLNIHLNPCQLPSGLFPVKMLKCQAELSDEIVLQEREREIKVEVDTSQVPKGQENLIFRAAKLLKEKFEIKKGVKIILKKKIPVKVGLGGGSADAAATLLGLNKLWGLKLNQSQLLKLAAKIGKDVCYSVIGGTALMAGQQENVKKLPFSLPKLPMVIVVPGATKPSTEWAYQNVDLKRIGAHEEKLERLIFAIKKNDLVGLGQNLHNDFEYSVGKKFPEIWVIEDSLLKSGALGAILAGAGLSVLGVYQDEKTARLACEKLKNQYHQVFLTRIL